MTFPRIKPWQILAGLGVAGILTLLFSKTFTEKLPKGPTSPYGPEKPPQNFRWPFDQLYPITSFYGNRPDPFNKSTIVFHYGIDISAALKTPVRAIADWTVLEAHKWNGGLTGVEVSGNYLRLQHPDGVMASYVHLYAPPSLRVGQTGKKGDIIALVGNTGKSQGAHLHFRTRVNGEDRDPLTIIPRTV
jgi:murein DD-endopeptidase MepM/ murein hydrolase activator NlpD